MNRVGLGCLFRSSVFKLHNRGVKPHLHTFPFRRCGTFVSSHFQLKANEALEYLTRKGYNDLRGNELVLKVCPFCHPIKNDFSNMYKLYVNQNTGTYNCFRCGSGGSWFDLRQKLGGNATATITASNGNKITLDKRGVKMEKKDFALPPQEKIASLTNQLFEDMEYKPILEYLTGTNPDQRHLKIEVLKKYGVGSGKLDFRMNDNTYQALPCITFPWMVSSGEIEYHDDQKTNEITSSPIKDKNEWIVTRIKARALSDKSKQRLYPSGGQWGLFGWHTVPLSATSVVLTEGEFDAMAVHQATGLPAVSLPNGCQSLPLEVVQMLERFSSIYLWTDNDLAGQQALEKFTTKLGPGRCYIVQIQGDEYDPSLQDNMPKTPPKDANDALKGGWDLKLMIERARRPEHKQITTFEELRKEVLLEISDPLQASGVQSQDFPTLNKLVKGHRRGEFTVVTGSTGCGKTSFLSQLSLDYCKNGVNTLWGSFEIKNIRLMKKMLGQLSGRNLEENIDHFDSAADSFQSLPMYFLRFFGSTNVDEVIDAMKYAVYVYDVEHIILDNLQFMLSGQGRGFDKFERQDDAIMKFRQFASSENVHITIVIHPRKEQVDQELSIASVFGSAKATQEADNVFILQQSHGKPRLEIKKNRFDGQLGAVDMSFDRSCCRFIDYQANYQEKNEVEAEEIKEPPFPPVEKVLDSCIVEEINPSMIYEMKSFRENDKAEINGYRHTIDTSKEMFSSHTNTPIISR